MKKLLNVINLAFKILLNILFILTSPFWIYYSIFLNRGRIKWSVAVTLKVMFAPVLYPLGLIFLHIVHPRQTFKDFRMALGSDQMMWNSEVLFPKE